MTSNTQVIDLSPARLNRTILKLALPSIAESLLSTMVYLADTIFIGWMNDTVALGAVGLSSTLMWAADGLFQAISLSASAIVARLWGEREFERAREVAGQSLLLSVITAVILMALFMPVASWFLKLMGGEPDLVVQGTAYIRILLATSPVSFTLTIANSLMRATGDTQKPMWTTGLMNVVNVVASYAFIFGLGPIPALGLRGAALSTSLARTVGGLCALMILFSSHTPAHLKRRHLSSWEWKTLWRILRISAPNIGETVISRLGFMLFMRILSSLGTVALAAHQIALRVESLAFMPGWGLAIAAAALVGQALGARRAEIAEAGIRRTLLLSNGVMAVLGCGFIVFARLIVRVFGVRDPELAAATADIIRISSLELLGLGSLMVLGGCLRGAGDTRTPMMVTIIGTFLFRVPLTYLFALTLHGGLRGVWLATAVDWSMRALIMYILYMRGRWKTVQI